MQSARQSIGSLRVAYPSGVAASAAPRRQRSMRRWMAGWRERVPRGPSAALLLGIAVVVLAIALAVAWWSALDAREDVEAARADQAAAEAEVAQLNAELQTSNDALDALEAEAAQTRGELEELQVRLSGGEEELGELSGEVVDLRQQLSDVQSDLDAAELVIEERDATVAAQESAIAALSDCLSGMQVALAFARSGQIDSADRAFATVSDSCDRAREFL